MDKEWRIKQRRPDWETPVIETRERNLRLKERYQPIRRMAIVSDIHGNLEALEAVIADLKTQDCQSIVCLGDTVGYGANPIECLDWVEANAGLSLLGNHDSLVIGRSNINYLASYARYSMLWTRKLLTDKHKDYLASLPLVVFYEDATFVHGTLYSPELFDYIQARHDAYISLQILESNLCFIGHSHVPITFFQGGTISYSLNPKIRMREGLSALVNVGSVGQPRDDNPKACYAVYDQTKHEIEVRRIEYDIDRACEKILGLGWPAPLAERLKYGR